MTWFDGQARWRWSFLQALELVGRATARLPFGIPDPVLCGGAAVELYTGSLWPAPDIELMAVEPRPVRGELMALGFRWMECPPHGERGLWHPGLQIGASVAAAHSERFSAAHVNTSTVALDIGASPGAAGVSLSVVGIEDLIVEQVADAVEHWGKPGNAASLITALVGLGRMGAGGRFRAWYLQRRLEAETLGEVSLEPLPPMAGFDAVGTRGFSLSAMAAVIGEWDARCGFPRNCSPRSDVRPQGSALAGTDAERVDISDQDIHAPAWTAQIIPFRPPQARPSV